MTGYFPAAHLNDPATVEHTNTSQADQPSICYCGVHSPGRARVGFDKLGMGPARRESPEVPTGWQGLGRLYSAEVPHSPVRFAVRGLPGDQELPGRPYLRHATGDFQSVDGESP